MVELNEETRWILGQPNFMCAKIATRLREIGHQIERRAEEEQAEVIHWMLTLYEKHGAKQWRDASINYLRGDKPCDTHMKPNA